MPVTSEVTGTWAPVPIMRYKAVLLDYYGTLVEEDGPVLAEITRRVAASSPLAPSQAQVYRRWWELMGGMCHAACGDAYRLQREIERDSLSRLLDEFGSGLDAVALTQPIFARWQAPRAYPDAVEFLGRLRLPACVVSNIDEADLRAAIASQGWDLPLVVTSETCRAYKPRPELFIAALRLLGLGPGDVLHVGDTLSSDVAGAQAAGIDVAWVNRHGRPAPPTPPTYTVTDLRQLFALL